MFCCHLCGNSCCVNPWQPVQFFCFLDATTAVYTFVLKNVLLLDNDDEMDGRNKLLKCEYSVEDASLTYFKAIDVGVRVLCIC